MLLNIFRISGKLKFERTSLPSHDLPPFDESQCQFTDNRLAPRSSKNNKINEFLTLLSVCHSIIPEYPGGKEKGKVAFNVVYNASSPDEKALVLFAKNIHYYFYDGHLQILKYTQIDRHRFYLNRFGKHLEFDIYNMLEFTSKRKRMSVIYFDPRDNKMKLYCKGAYNITYQRLTKEFRKSSEWNKTFASRWFTTLICGYKEINGDYYCEWLSKLNRAKSAIENRDILVEECYNEIEKDLLLLGATAIEDKLQNGVSETIANLSIWVLTGDKLG
eukprot:76820_1